MKKRENIKTTIEKIVDYWSKNEDECGLSVDFSEAHERCWRCGHKRKLERCHIVPASLGGADEPSNFVLLCKKCHEENPNVTDPQIMWDWLRAYAVPFYDTFWQEMGVAEYERIYGIKFIDEVAARNMPEQDFNEILKLLEKATSKATHHFGNRYLNAATFAGVLRIMLKEYDKLHGIKTNEKIISIYKRQMNSETSNSIK